MVKSLNILNKRHVIWFCLIIFLLLLAGCRGKTIPINSEDTIFTNTSKDTESEVISSNSEGNSKNANQQNINEFSVIFDDEYLSLKDWDKDININGILGEPIEETIEILGNNSDTFAGSSVKTLKYQGLTIKLFSPSHNGKEFWIINMLVNDQKYRTFRGISVGSTLSELKSAYENIRVLDGKTDINNCAYTFNEEELYIRFEVENKIIKEIILYIEIP